MIRIQIPRRSRSCLCCQERFTPGQTYSSVLTAGTKEGQYERHDYCSACWEEKSIDDRTTFWRAKIPERKSIVEDPEEHYQEVLELLHQEIERDTLASQKVAFVLALYLSRKKRLALRQQMESHGTPLFLYEMVLTGEMVPVKKVHLTTEQLNEIQEDLNQRFS